MRQVKLLILILILLYGCSRNERELVIYLSLLPSEEKNYQELLRKFHERTGIKTRLISQQYSQINQAVESEVKAGKGVVDIFEVDVYSLRPLSRFASDLSGLEDYFESCNLYREAYNAGKIDGRLSFIPHRISCQAVIYNSKYIKNPPATWEDYKRLMIEFPRKIGLKASLYEGLVCDIFPIVWSFKGDILNLKDKNTQKALHFLKSLAVYIHPGSRAFKENSILEAQAREEIYLHFNWPFSVNYLKEKRLCPWPNKSAPMPKGVVRASILGGGYLAISRAAPHKKEAAQFLRFIETRYSQEFLLRRLGWFPTRRDAWEAADESLKEDFSGFIDSLRYARARPSMENYIKLSQIWQRIVESLVFRGESVEFITEKFSGEISSILDE